ncbi:uncharacterized protein LOC141671813 isoform X2 [Apium graveolens]|uniref:uncharacterized protein LOC141671813 isoform X2 n=1 Tax=Apium graveolens TaxID=4045 RepID=UPI003D79C4AA
MAKPKKHVPDHQGPMQTSENTSDESLDISFVFSDDDPTGENATLDDNNQFGEGTSQARPPGGANDQSNEHLSENFNPEILDCGKSTQLLQWPVPPQPYTCSNCQVLREIIHTIDGEIRKFEIHGRVGMIFHGILEIRRGENKECQMFDFCKISIPDVKTFLLEYCEERTQAGYTLLKDPLFAFCEALSVGSDWEYGLDIDEILRASPTPHLGENVEQPEAESSKRRSKRKRAKKKKTRSKKRKSFKDQREFCKTLHVKDFVDYFNLTIDEAADKVGIGTTKFKNILHDEKFSWPNLTIRKIEKEIAEISKDLNSTSPRKRASAKAEIEQKRKKIEEIYAPYRET